MSRIETASFHQARYKQWQNMDAYRMAQQEKRGLIDKGLGIGKTLSKLTLVGGVGLGVAGLAIGNPVLATLGLTSAAVDVGQIVVIKNIEQRRKKKHGSMKEYREYKKTKKTLPDNVVSLNFKRPLHEVTLSKAA